MAMAISYAIAAMCQTEPIPTYALKCGMHDVTREDKISKVHFL
jgi:hypothetical protein